MPFAPSDLSGLIFWWKADALSLADGASVSSWVDSSANAWNAAQATAGQQPTFHTAPTGFNGKPAVLFDGVNDILSHAFSATLNPAAMTLFVVLNLVSLTGNQRAVTSHDQSVGTTGYDLLASTGAGAATFGVRSAGGLVTASVAPGAAFLSAGTTYICSATNSGTVSVGYNDGTLEQTNGAGTLTPNAADPFYLGGDPNFGSNNIWLNGYLAEVVGYSRVLTTAERSSVDTYLGTKYNVTISDPTSVAVPPVTVVRQAVTRASVW